MKISLSVLVVSVVMSTSSPSFAGLKDEPNYPPPECPEGHQCVPYTHTGLPDRTSCIKDVTDGGRITCITYPKDWTGGPRNQHDGPE